MKRFLSILLCVAVILSLCACSVDAASQRTLKRKVASKVSTETVKNADQYAALLQDNIDAADKEYDSEVGFAQYSFNHTALLALSNSIKDSDGVKDVSGFRYDLIKISYIVSTINYGLQSYSEDAMYDETMKLLSLDPSGLETKLEKSQAISDYAKAECEAFLKHYYRRTIDPASIMKLLKKSDDEEASASA